MRVLLVLFFISTALFAMGERVDYSVDELSRIPFKQRASASTSMFSKSIAHWKDELRIKGIIDPYSAPSLNLVAIRKLKKIAVVDLELGFRSMSERPAPVDWKESDLLASQCLSAVGTSLKLSGFSVVTQDKVARLLQTEPDWIADESIASAHVLVHAASGTWMSWPNWIEKPLFAKDRAIRIMDALDVDALVWVSSRILLVKNTTQQAIFSASPYSYGEWWQNEYSGQSKWTSLGIEMTVMTRKGLSSERLVAWSAATKGDWSCPPILMNAAKGGSKNETDFRLAYSRYPILASFRVILETMSAQLKQDVLK